MDLGESPRQVNAGVSDHISSCEALGSGKKWGQASLEQCLWKMGVALHGSPVITAPGECFSSSGRCPATAFESHPNAGGS